MARRRRAQLSQCLLACAAAVPAALRQASARMRRMCAAWLCLWLLRERIAGFHATASVRMQYKPSCDVQMQARPGVHARVAPQSTKVATSSPVQYPHATSLCKQKVLGRSERSLGTATGRSRLETAGRDGLLAAQGSGSGSRYSGAEKSAGILSVCDLQALLPCARLPRQ